MFFYGNLTRNTRLGRLLLVSFALSATFSVTFPLIASAQTATVIRNVNLRPTPSTNQNAVRLLTPPESLTLTEPNPTLGYYHIRTSQSEEGWVWARNISFSSSNISVLSVTPTPGAPAPSGHLTTASNCPPVGRNKKSEVLSKVKDDGLRNMAKRWVAGGTTGTLLDIDDLKALQKDVDAAVHGNARTTKHRFEPTRDDLHDRSTAHGTTISEGDLVRVAGYLQLAKSEGPESVNCYAADKVDIHINITEKKSATEFQGIVVEMIPQLRLTGWDPKAAGLKRVQKTGLQVMAVGSLTYDNEHKTNGDATHPNGTQPKRVSLWEIHPVTQFYVCPAAATCDPTTISGNWMTLTEWVKKNPK